MSTTPATGSSRRDFLGQATTAVVAGSAAAAALQSRAYAAEDETLRIGIVGCGGRGRGAVADAMAAHPKNRLAAIGDLFPDRVEYAMKVWQGQKDFADRIDVTPDTTFTGIDAFKQVIANCDVVLLATPPHFRPEHLAHAIQQGRHVFCEKPVAVDGPGVRSVLETTKLARQKNLAIVSGLCYRYHTAMRAAYERIHGGEIGDVVALRTSYFTGGLWKHDRQSDWSDLEFQIRNWLYYTWLSGDHIVEQHIHSLDKVAWAMGDQTPVAASATGGRLVRTDDIYGNVYDHFAVEYEYEGGLRAFSRCRQQDGCYRDVTDHVYGTKGYVDIMKQRQYTRDGKQVWRYKGPNPSMYRQEHVELFASIRNGQPLNNGEYMAHSTLMAIMGRDAAYTGKRLTWDEALNSKERLGPESYEFGPMQTTPVRLPGLA